MKQHNQNIIVINGRTYDARSGLQISNVRNTSLKKVFSDVGPAGPQKIPPHATLAQHKPVKNTTNSGHSTSNVRHSQAQVAKKLHRTPQKASTLLRTAVKRPAAAPLSARPRVHASNHHAARLEARMARAEHLSYAGDIRHFTPAHKMQAHTTPAAAPATPAAQTSSLALAQLQSTHIAPPASQTPAQPQLSGSQLKEMLIQQQLAAAPVNREEKFHAHQHKVNSFFSKQPRLLSAIAGTIGVLLLVAYVTYLNMPGISLRIAASRAGFAAAMPGYTPSGYSLDGPVAYSPGQVSLSFGSNTNSDIYTLMQKQSNWDTQALLDNYVGKHTSNYLTYQEKGLTIFMYDGKASWVNGGVWYNIDGSAKLSSDQILKIATSM